MPRHRVVNQCPHIRLLPREGGEFESPHPDVARRHAHQHRALQFLLAENPLARRRHRQAPRGRNPQRMHRLAHDVFPQHRPERRPPVPAPRVGRPPAALDLNIAPHAVQPHMLAQQDRPPVPEHREIPELVPRIRLRDRLRSGRHMVPGKNYCARRRIQPVRIQSHPRSQRAVECHQPRRPHRDRLHPREKHLRQTRIAVVEPESRSIHPSTLPAPPRPRTPERCSEMYLHQSPIRKC